MDDDGVNVCIQKRSSSSLSMLPMPLNARTKKRKKSTNVNHFMPAINNDDGNSIHLNKSTKKKENHGHYELLWSTRLRELASYKEEVGDTNVPQKCAKNKDLGNWVKI